MIRDEESNNYSNDELKNLIKSYIDWEKEKEEILLFKNDKIKDSCDEKNFYLIDKEWLNKFKEIIKYKELIDYIKSEKTNNDSINIDEIINLFIDKNSINLNNINKDINDKNDIENELINNKNFIFEVINEKFNKLLKNVKNKYKIIGKIMNNKILFEMVLKNFKIIFLIFPIEKDNICKLFLIFKEKDKNYSIEINRLEKEDYKNILNRYEINLSYVDENGINKKFKINEENLFIVVKKSKYKSNYLFYLLNKDINNFFKALKKSNCKFNNAIKNEDIHNNYSPCKLINLDWMKIFINYFDFKSHNKFIINHNFTEFDYKKITGNFPKLTQENIEKGEFFIFDENCVLSLLPLIPTLKKEDFIDYQIFLNNNKGAIIIKDDIFIFETNEDINQRLNYDKIKSQKKFEILYNMGIKKEYSYKLSEENWNLLKSNINDGSEIENKEKNKLNDKKKNTKIISNKIRFSFLGDKDETKLKEENLREREDNLNEKEKIIKLKEQNINEKEKEINQKLKILNENKIVILNKNIPTIGLENLGATCYMNAPLQCLVHCIEISEKILTWYKYKNDKNKQSKSLSYEYAKLLDNLYFPNENNNLKYYSPNKFKELVGILNPLFKGIKANDSKDLLNFIIERMHQELNPLGESNLNEKNDNLQNIIYDQSNELLTLNNFKRDFSKNFHSFFSEYLYAIQKTITLCCFCNSMVFNFQTYNFLIFPLLDVKNYIIYNNYQNPFFNNQNYVLNLIDCFKYYQKIDFFSGENQIFCNKCQAMQNANYCTLLYSVPTILCIVLNRGKNNMDFQENINFGTQLDLSNFVQDKSDIALYYLIGVVVHVGDSSMNGHFFAYCRAHFKSPWYKYNDSIVSQSNENDIYSVGTPYILFYHKYQ